MIKAFVSGGSGFVGRNLILALKGRGDSVRALARSPNAIEAVRALGAEPVEGDLDDVALLRRGMAGCDVVFHGAAIVTDWGPREEFERVNVQGTANMLESARAAGVPRFVHVSTEAVLIGGPHLHDADESWPYPDRPGGLYPETKGKAERLVRSASSARMTTVVIRPALVWGKGDTSVLPQVGRVIKAGRFWWIAGRYLKSTSHVANVVEGLLLASERGRGGEVYFVLDGPPVEFRPFFADMLRASGYEPGERSLPRSLVVAIAFLSEMFWHLFQRKGQPFMRRTALHILAEEITISDAKARRELGYVGRMTRERGLKEMAA